MTQPLPSSADLERFSQRTALAIHAAESGEAEFEGEPIDRVLQDARRRLEQLVESSDSLVSVTAQEQLHRVRAVLDGMVMEEPGSFRGAA